LKKTNKISNLYRLNIYNTITVILYALKKIIKIEPSLFQNNVYKYYNFLIADNGFLFAEEQSYFITIFKKTNLKLKLRKNTSDLEVYNQIFSWQAYKSVVDLYNELFAEKENIQINILDAGSNIGLSAVYFLNSFKNSKIACIEPETSNFKILEFNLQNFNEENIYKIKGAIWSKNTFIKIVSDFRDKLSWSFRVEESYDSKEIRAYTINSILAKCQMDYIDILKIDVEGAEKQLFTSAESDVTFLKKTKCLALEIHDEFNCRQDIYAVLQDYKFNYFVEGELLIAYNTLLLNN
jgi:FkbM family methyltransferase